MFVKCVMHTTPSSVNQSQFSSEEKCSYINLYAYLIICTESWSVTQTITHRNNLICKSETCFTTILSHLNPNDCIGINSLKLAFFSNSKMTFSANRAALMFCYTPAIVVLQEGAIYSWFVFIGFNESNHWQFIAPSSLFRHGNGVNTTLSN